MCDIFGFCNIFPTKLFAYNNCGVPVMYITFKINVVFSPLFYRNGVKPVMPILYNRVTKMLSWPTPAIQLLF